MRLSDKEVSSLKQVFRDLSSAGQLTGKALDKHKWLAAIKRKLGDRKIDLTLSVNGTESFVSEILTEAIPIEF